MDTETTSASEQLAAQIHAIGFTAPYVGVIVSGDEQDYFPASDYDTVIRALYRKFSDRHARVNLRTSGRVMYDQYGYDLTETLGAAVGDVYQFGYVFERLPF